MNIEQQRAEFEAACRKHAEEAGYDPDVLDFIREGEGYANPARQAAWWGWREGRAALTAQPSVPEGWKLVPVEPTEEMSDAGWAHIDITAGQCQDGPQDVYRAMLVAAPTPPAGRAALQSQSINAGWKEAAIAWEVCASIHREYCKGKDPLFKTRRADFVKHAEDARTRALETEALQSQDSERLDFITSKPGVCYALVSDDSGRWALTDAGMGPVAPDQGFTETVGITSIVDPDMWKSSPREAIDHARRVEENE